ncbi:MAG: tRNA1(Val) (adenine(37)-N6)-methyltransferase [Clostridia bacterium]|nr:tRNA1(Val) (adenine(37)-N6)-methyltransferase [Clostridia bacterium]
MEHERERGVNAYLKDGERLDDLQLSGLRLIQRPDAFRFGTDSVLLADFAAPKRTDRAVDLGCGTGAIAMLMAAHCPGLHVDAVEIQPEIADMARRSVELNQMQESMTVHEMDMRDAWKVLGAEKFSVVVCNPPYGRKGSVLLSENETKRIARHEGDLTAEDVAQSASKLLKSGGKLCVVYPAPRAYEMMRAMDRHRIAPKRIRTVHGVADRAPKFVLIDGVKDGGEQLHWLPPLTLRNADGSFTAEWKRIYRMEEE